MTEEREGSSPTTRSPTRRVVQAPRPCGGSAVPRGALDRGVPKLSSAWTRPGGAEIERTAPVKETLELTVAELDCADGARQIESALGRLTGVSEVRTAPEAIRQAIYGLGMT